MSLKKFFSVDEEIPKKTKLFISILGWLFLFVIWWGITTLGWINPYILPPPEKVFSSYGVLLTEKSLFYHIGYSISINILGYIQAISIAVPLGFVIGLFRSLGNSSSNKLVLQDSLLYLQQLLFLWQYLV